MSVQDKGDYDALAQRSKGKGGATYAANAKGAKSTSTSAPAAEKSSGISRVKPVSAASKKETQKENKAPPPPPSSVATAPSRATTVKASALTSSSSSSSPASNEALVAAKNEIESLKAANEVTSRNLEVLKSEMDGLEKERDFYFEKLREIEVLMQELEDAGNGNEMTQQIFKILYATADGFEKAEEAETAAAEAN